MPGVSGWLSNRRVKRGPSLPGPQIRTLADLPAGTVAQILDMDATVHPATARRMFDLGFAPGTEVELVRRAPMADPVVFRIAGYEIALRRTEARCIRVQPS